MYTEIHTYLNAHRDPVRGPKEQAYLKTDETVYGIPRGLIRTLIKGLMRSGDSLSFKELQKLWDTHIVDARFAAMTYAELLRRSWDRKWVDLFVSWAQTKDTGWHNTDVIGPHLLGMAYLDGTCPRSVIMTLKRSDFLWTWRVGMTTLIPSLKGSSRDWKLLLAFADDCVLPGSKFHKQYFALKGLSMTLRWAIPANKARVLKFLKDNDGRLTETFIKEIRNKATIGRKR